MIIYIS
jgi:hypothetical protein